MAGVYVHVPFCSGKCAYCSFYSRPLRTEAAEYVAALLQEWHRRQSQLGEEPIHTLYLGGGTPSCLPLEALGMLIEGLPTAGLEEFTIEANPEDVTSEWIAAVRAMGCTRISMGVQSLNDSELQAIGRRHTAAQARQALEALQASGVNFSADLIYGLPGQTLEQWQWNLRELLAYRPYHLSAYMLTYEPGTRLWARLQQGKVAEADDELAQQMYHALCDMAAEAGYEHYEISNFALPGFRSRHNAAYWDLTPYLGLGPAAHSLLGTTRSYNPPDLCQYLRILSLPAPAIPAVEDPETLDERFDDYIMIRLRTAEGLSLRRVEQLFGPTYRQYLLKQAQPLLSAGLLVSPFPDHIAIPPRLWLTSDATIRDLMRP